jgi:uncharacterized phage-associated protein
MRDWERGVAGFARFDVSVSAHDVAGELRRRFPSDPGVVKLHKLLYYAQGWHLAWAGQPLFRERIEAWTNGPVVADLWHDEKKNRPRPALRELVGAQLATIDYVVDRYGRDTAKDLIRRTHDEGPWREASEADADGWGLNNAEIDHASLRRWFVADDEYVARKAEVERLRRSGGSMFAPLELTDELQEAVARAVRGQRVRHSRPA